MRDTVNARPQCAPAIQVDPFPIPKTLFPQRDTGHSLWPIQRDHPPCAILPRKAHRPDFFALPRPCVARSRPTTLLSTPLAQPIRTSTPLAAPSRSSNTNTHPIQTRTPLAASSLPPSSSSNQPLLPRLSVTRSRTPLAAPAANNSHHASRSAHPTNTNIQHTPRGASLASSSISNQPSLPRLSRTARARLAHDTDP